MQERDLRNSPAIFTATMIAVKDKDITNKVFVEFMLQDSDIHNLKSSIATVVKAKGGDDVLAIYNSNTSLQYEAMAHIIKGAKQTAKLIQLTDRPNVSLFTKALIEQVVEKDIIFRQ